MSKPPPAPAPGAINPSDYSHSPAHYFVAARDHASLSRLASSLPRPPDPARVATEAQARAQEPALDRISAALDRRDGVPFRETPLHLAVRLNDPVACRLLCLAGADVSLQNSAGWNPLQEALCRRLPEVSRILAQHHHLSAWAKWRRRLPRVVAALWRMRDFYLEIQFHFESSIVPFIGKIAPSDTYRIWKRDGNLRADTTLAGFDGMKIQRADQSFLFLGDGEPEHGLPEGSLLVLNRDDRTVVDAFESAGAPLSEGDVASFYAQPSVYRPGMDVTRAELVGRTNWRRQERRERVGEWEARVFEVHNVVVSFRSRRAREREEGREGDGVNSQVLPLELDEDEDGFLVAENFEGFECGGGDGRRHSSFVRDQRVEREWVSVGRKSVDINFAPPPPRRSVDLSFAPPPPTRKSVDVGLLERRRASSVTSTSRVAVPVPPSPATSTSTKEKEFIKSLRPSVWLTEQFPLKTEELLPLLDILANKVKAVRRMRELLTTKFPPGSFPVKISIPVVPTVKVVITFTKFVQLQPTELFYTPLSSPRLLSSGNNSPEGEGEEEEERESRSSSRPSFSSAPAWLRRSNSSRSSNKQLQQQCPEALEPEPFAIPSGYSWESMDRKNRKMKKSRSGRRSK